MFSDPTANLKQFDLRDGMSVADFGAGSGHYSIAAAKIMHGGKVYAIDVQKDLLARLKSEAERNRASGIEIISGDIEKKGGTKLADKSVDRVIFSNILFQLEDKKGGIAEARRILKDGGKLLLIDWSDSWGGMGPAQSAVVSASKAEELFTANGFSKEREIDAGANHYGMIFVKN